MKRPVDSKTTLRVLCHSLSRTPLVKRLWLEDFLMAMTLAELTEFLQDAIARREASLLVLRNVAAGKTELPEYDRSFFESFQANKGKNVQIEDWTETQRIPQISREIESYREQGERAQRLVALAQRRGKDDKEHEQHRGTF